MKKLLLVLILCSHVGIESGPKINALLIGTGLSLFVTSVYWTNQIQVHNGLVPDALTLEGNLLQNKFNNLSEQKKRAILTQCSKGFFRIYNELPYAKNLVHQRESEIESFFLEDVLETRLNPFYNTVKKAVHDKATSRSYVGPIIVLGSGLGLCVLGIKKQFIK